MWIEYSHCGGMYQSSGDASSNSTMEEKSITISSEEKSSEAESKSTEEAEAEKNELQNWSEWVEQLPSEVKLSNYAIEEKSVFIPKQVEGGIECCRGNKRLGGWSEWQDAPVAQTSTCQVETRQVDDYNSPIYKTQYQYDRWAEKSDGWGHNGPVKGTWGGVYCQYYIVSDWMDEPLKVVNTQYSEQVGGYFNNYGSWYNETTRVVETGAESVKTQYRYREMESIEVWSEWSAYSDEKIAEGDDVEVREKTLYRYKKKNKTSD